MKNIILLLIGLFFGATANAQTLNSATYTAPSALSANVSYSTTQAARLTLVAAPVYYSDAVGYEDDSQAYITYSMVNGTGTTTMVGFAPPGRPPVGMVLVGWRVQVYETINNVLVGASNEILVPKG